MQYAPSFKKLLISLAFLSISHPLYALANNSPLFFTKVIEKSQQMPPVACVISNGSFKDYVDESKIDFKDNLNNKVKTLISVNDNEICFNSLKHGQKYSIEFKKGFKDSIGQTLLNSQKLDFDIADAKELIYKQDGIIMPLNYDPIINIDTINVDTLHVDILKAGDKNLDDIEFNDLINQDSYFLNKLIENQGILVKSLNINVEHTKNERHTTQIRLKDYIDKTSGLYFIKVNNKKDGVDRIETTFAKIISDLALTEFLGSDNIATLVKSYTKGESLKGVKLKLISKNNDVLEEGISDKNGFYKFKGTYLKDSNLAKAPAYIIASYDDDIIFDDLNSNHLYLDEKYAKLSKKTQLFAYTERGIYRPGEVVFTTILARDKAQNSKDIKKLIAKIIAPNGVVVAKNIINAKYKGGFEFEYKIAKNAMRGNYTIDLSEDGDTSLASIDISVNDFIPQTLKIESKSHQNITQDINNITLNATFLYGAKASNLEYNATSYSSYNYNFLKGYEDFSFGVKNNGHKNFEQSYGKTDANGDFLVNTIIQDSTYPQILTVNASVYDTQNQAISFFKTYPIKSDKAYLGVKDVEDNGTTKLYFAYVKDDTSHVKASLKYKIHKINHLYHFVLENNNWVYKSISNKSFVKGGTLDLKDNDSLNQIDLDLDYGHYEISAYIDDTLVCKNDFYKGFNYDGDATNPHLLNLVTDKKAYNTQDDIKLSFNSLFDGFATITLCDNKIEAIENVEIKRGENTFTIKAPDNRSQNLYALVHATRDLKSSKNPVVRSIGLTHIAFDNTDKILNISTNIQDDTILKPNSSFSFDLKVESEDNSYISASLVDVGILNLTDYKAPKPDITLLEPQAFNYSIIDKYGYLVKTQNQGYGDEAQSLEGLSAIPTRTVALHKKLFKVKDGIAHITFDIPNFQGTLKLMLVGFNDKAIGSYQKDIIVRDNVVVSSALPRFISTYDTSSLRLNLDNIDNKSSSFDVHIACQKPLSCNFKDNIKAPLGQRVEKYFDIKADKVGVGEVNVKVFGDNFTFEDNYPLTVTKPYPQIIESTSDYVKKGESIKLHLNHTFDDDVIVTATLASLPFVNLHYLAKRLENDLSGPFTQKLYAAKELLLFDDKMVKDRNDLINNYVDLISSYQTSDGKINNKYDNSYSDFLSLMSMDFLIDATKQGFVIKGDILNKLINANKEIINGTSDDTTKALYYAILSKTMRVNVSALRYLFESTDSKEPLFYIYMAEAFNNLGDVSRTNEAIDKSYKYLKEWQELVDKLHKSNSFAQIIALFYQIQRNYEKAPIASLTHDCYKLINLMAKTQNADRISDVLSIIKTINIDINYLSESTILTIVESAITTGGDSATKHIMLDGNGPFSILNDTDANRFVTLSAFGYTQDKPKSYANSLTLSKVYLDKNLNIIKSNSSIEQNDYIYVYIEAIEDVNIPGSLYIREPFVAGFEYEAVTDSDINYDKLNKKLKLDDSVYASEQKSDDILLFKATMSEYEGEFKAVYKLRAAVIGTYQVPAISAYMLKNNNINALYSPDIVLNVTKKR